MSATFKGLQPYTQQAHALMTAHSERRPLPGSTGLCTAAFRRPRLCSGRSCCARSGEALRGFRAWSGRRSSSRLCVSTPASASSSSASFTCPGQPSVKQRTPSLLCAAAPEAETSAQLTNQGLMLPSLSDIYSSSPCCFAQSEVMSALLLRTSEILAREGLMRKSPTFQLKSLCSAR